MKKWNSLFKFLRHFLTITAEEWVAVQRLSERTENVGDMVVVSEELRKVLKTITKLSPYRQTVLIEGESGTGKDLIARALHNFSGAPNGPFVTFNCSNLVASLAEAQLFGHVKGAYTDAREDALGYFRSANGGTLFLDEIGELPLNLQPKLLRAVENREIQPVGSTHVFKVDLRLIAATNRDLRAMMKKGRVPRRPLLPAELRGDRRPAVAQTHRGNSQLRRAFHRALQQALRQGCQDSSPREAVHAMCKYPWPGNIRELAHVIETAVLMTDLDRLTISDLPSQILQYLDRSRCSNAGARAVWRSRSRQTAAGPPRSRSRPRRIGDCRRNRRCCSMTSSRRRWCGRCSRAVGNRRRAADLLGVSRSTLYRMLARYELEDANRANGLGNGIGDSSDPRRDRARHSAALLPTGKSRPGWITIRR